MAQNKTQKKDTVIHDPEFTLSGHFIEFDVPACNCKTGESYKGDGIPVFTLSIKPTSDCKKYAFTIPDGLTEIYQKNGSCIYKDQILADFLSLKLDYNRDSVEELARFINKYGFFFDISKYLYINIDYSDLRAILKRFKDVCFIHRQIGEVEKEYRKLFECIITMISSESVELKNETNNILFTSFENPFISLMDRYVSIIPESEYNTSKLEYDGDPVYFGDKEEVLLSGSAISEFYDTYLQSVQQINIVDKETNNVLEHVVYSRPVKNTNRNYDDEYDLFDDDFEDEVETEDVSTLAFNALCNFKELEDKEKIVYIYFTLPEKYISCRYIVDLFYHIIRDQPMINEDDIDFNLQRHSIYEYLEWYSKYLIDRDEFHKHLLRVAKGILKEELNYVMKNITLEMNIETLRPEWNIPDLFSAMHLSLFYMDPEYGIYRKCARNICNNAFLVTSTNRKKKYCCIQCSNAEGQQKHRDRIKEENSQDKPYIFKKPAISYKKPRNKD